MTAAEPEQEELPTTRRGNKRAGAVCLRCHEKKIKCDLQSLIGQESPRCRNCTLTDSVCRLRSSRRAAGRREQHHHHHAVDSPHLPAASPSAIPPPPQPHGHPSPSPALQQLLNIAAEEHSAQFQGGIETGAANGQAQLSDHAPFNVTPGQGSASSASQQLQQQQSSYLGDSGYMQIFSHETGGAETTSPQTSQMSLEHVDEISLALQAGYMETYFEYAHVWCPVIDRETFLHPDVANSLLVRHALALCGNRIRPPLLEHVSSSAHYNRAKSLFYANYETSPVLRISALMLFYWWSAGPPNVISIDTNWWWTGAAIRLAQEIGLHREPQSGSLFPPGETVGIRRRIWWTLFARERITAISQGRPCIIDPDYCDVRMVSHEDFSDPADVRTEVFIQWIRLSEIMGRIGKRLCRRVQEPSSTAPLALDLITWVQSLPSTVQLHLNNDGMSAFNRDVHGLHLVYLATITLLNLSKAIPPNSLPKASITAIVAASYIARIFEDYLARGSVRFLAGQAGWYIAVAILALLDARHIEGLAVHADRDIRSLRVALKQMAELWHSAKMFDAGFDKLIMMNSLNHSDSTSSIRSSFQTQPGQQATLGSIGELPCSVGDMNWMHYFPAISEQASPLVSVVLTNNQAMPFVELQWPVNFMSQLHDFFTSDTDFNFEFNT